MKILIEGKTVDISTLSMFLQKLVTPFENTDAFRLGIIDKNGNVLKHRKNLKTFREKEAYTEFDTLVFNLKKFLNKFPAGRTLQGSAAAAALLLREENNIDFLERQEIDEKFLIQEFFNIFEETTADVPTLQDEPHKKKNTIVVDRMPYKTGKSRFKIYKYI